MKMPASSKTFLIRYTTIAVILIVSVIQFVLIRTVHISPWKGGGFGMFSTINTPISHIIRVYNYTPSGEKQQILIPEKLKPLEKKIRHIAIAYYTGHFKEAIQKENWVLNAETGVINVKEAADSSAAVQLNNISVELWQYKFDRTDKKYYTEFIEKY